MTGGASRLFASIAAVAFAIPGPPRSVAQEQPLARPRIEIGRRSWSDTSGHRCEPPEVAGCMSYTRLSFEGLPAVSSDGSVVAYHVYGGELHEVIGIAFQRIGPGHLAGSFETLALRSLYYGELGSEAYLRALERDVAAVHRRFARGGFREMRPAVVERWRSEERAFRRPGYRNSPVRRHYYRVRAESGGPVLFDISEITPNTCAGDFHAVDAWIDVRTRVVVSRWHHAYCDGCTDAYVDRAEPWPGARGSTPWVR
jgi:hypothetical protein